MKINLCKTLSNKKEVIEVEPLQTIKEAFPKVDFNNAVIVVNGKIKESDYILQPYDIVIIRQTPAVSTTTLLWILAGVALIGGGVAGYSMYKSMEARDQAEKELEKAKKLYNKPDIDNRPFLRGASNTLATGNLQPYIIGRHFFTPYLLTKSFYEIIGDKGQDQYIYIALGCGFNKQIIQNISIDDVKLKTFSDKTPQQGTFNIDSSIFAEDGKIEIIQDGSLFTELPQLNYKTESVSCRTEIVKEKIVKEGSKPYTDFTLDPYAKDVTVAVTFPNGLYKLNKKNDKEVTDLQINLEYSLDGGKTFLLGDTKWISENTIKENRYNFYHEFTFEDYETLRQNEAESIVVRMRSLGIDDSKVVNTAYVLFYQSVCFDPSKSINELVPCLIMEERERKFSTLLGLKIKASKVNEDKLTKINIISQGIARTWNGEKWSEEKTATRNPASWALEIETSDRHPASKYDDSELDLESFGEFYEYCEKNNFKFDYVITRNTKKDDILNYILDATNSCIYTDIFGRRAIATDKEQENAIAVYNPQNIISISNKKSFSRMTDALRIKYVNSKKDLFKEDTYLVMREENGKPLELTDDSLIKDVTVTGITEHEHIVKYARHLMAVEKLRPKITTVEVGNEGIYFTPFSKVLIQDDSLKLGIGNGYTIKECIYKSGLLKKIILNEYVDFDKSKTYGIIVNCFDGIKAVPLALKIEGTGTTNELSVLTKIRTSDDVKPEAQNVLSFGELDNDGEFSKITTPFMISQIKRSSKGFTLDLVNYNEAIYDNGTIPEYQSNLTLKTSDIKNEIPKDTVTRGELDEAIEEVSKINAGEQWAKDSAQEAVEVVTHGVHFSNVHKIRDIDYSLDDLRSELDGILSKTNSAISITDERITIAVEDSEKTTRAAIDVKANEITQLVEDTKKELRSLLRVQDSAITAMVEGGGDSGHLSLSLELPVLIDEDTRYSFARFCSLEEFEAVYAQLENTHLYTIKKNAPQTAIKKLWDKAVKKGWLASQIDLSATQINIAAENIKITAENNKGKTIIENGLIKTDLIDVDKLLAQLVTLKNGGAIQSNGFISGQAGFKIESNGNVEFNNGVFNGEVNATSGSFSGMIKQGTNFFVATRVIIKKGEDGKFEYFSSNEEFKYFIHSGTGKIYVKIPVAYENYGLPRILSHYASVKKVSSNYNDYKDVGEFLASKAINFTDPRYQAESSSGSNYVRATEGGDVVSYLTIYFSYNSAFVDPFYATLTLIFV